MNDVETPFRVVLDPPIGSLDSLLTIKLNQIIAHSLSTLKFEPENLKSETIRLSFEELYEDVIDKATSEISDLL
jgi:hypothetical protein